MGFSLGSLPSAKTFRKVINYLAMPLWVLPLSSGKYLSQNCVLDEVTNCADATQSNLRVSFAIAEWFCPSGPQLLRHTNGGRNNLNSNFVFALQFSPVIYVTRES
jgi:hypothetical protein